MGFILAPFSQYVTSSGEKMKPDVSILSLSPGPGPPDAGSTLQKHYPVWAIQFHSQLPPSESLITPVLPQPLLFELSVP